jgi:predicted RNase H-like HicB family nuclease
MKLNVFIKPDPEDGGYNVSCPALPGCHSQGETIEEAVGNIQEAVEDCLNVFNNRITSLKSDEKVAEVVICSDKTGEL